MKILSVIIAVLAIVVGCRPPVPDVIALDGECDSVTLRYSDIVSRVRYTVLDAEDKARLGRILDIERTESYIFVISQGVDGVLQFDIEGRMLRRIVLPKDEAPHSIAVDNDNRLLTVGCGKVMHVYNFSGRHLRAVPLSGDRRWDVISPSPGYLCKIALPSAADDISDGVHLAEIVSYGDSIIGILAYRDTLSTVPVRMTFPQLYGYAGGGTMEILPSVSDTVFAIGPGGMRTVVTVEPSGTTRYRKGKGLRKPDPAAYHIESMMSTPSRIYLQVCRNDSLTVVAYDRASGAVGRYNTGIRVDEHMARCNIFVNDYDGGPGAWGNFPLSDGGHATMIYPSDIETLRYNGKLDRVRSKELHDALARATDMPMVMFIDFK